VHSPQARRLRPALLRASGAVRRSVFCWRFTPRPQEKSPPPSLTAHVLAARLGSPLQWEPLSLGGSAGPAPRTRLGHQAVALDTPSGLVYMYGGVVVDQGERHGLKAEPGVWTYDTRAQVGVRRHCPARVRRRSLHHTCVSHLSAHELTP